MITKEFKTSEKGKIVMEAPVEFSGKKWIGFRRKYLDNNGNWQYAKGGFNVAIEEAEEFADVAIAFLTELKGTI